MSGNSKLLSLIAAILVGSALIAGTVHLIRTPRDFPQIVRLPDGSDLILSGVTFGTNHVSPVPFLRQIADHLPPKLVGWFHLPPRATMSSASPTLGIWFDHRTNVAVAPLTPTEYRVTFLDDSGLESLDSDMWMGVPLPAAAQGITTAAFPRRSPIIRMRLYDRPSGAASVRLASFQFANPVFAQYPEWRPGPATARSRTGEFEATVRRFRVGRDCDMDQPFSYGNAEHEWLHGEAAFAVRYHGRDTTNWSVERLEMSDATGNHLTQNHWSRSEENGLITMAFGPALWPDGSAWKVRARFVRLPSAEFTTNELVTFKNIPLPGPHAATPGSWTTNLPGGTLTLKGLAGAHGALSDTRRLDQAGSFRRNQEIIVADFASGTNDLNLSIVKLESSLGQVTQAQLVSGGGKEYQFRTTFPTNANTVDITFAVHPSQFLDFTVKPELVTTKAPKPNRPPKP